MPAAKRPKKTASGYRMPEHLDEGTVLRDLMKKEWTLGASIGMGGFGEIYLAAEGNNKPTKENSKYVVKIEPKENGPLFVEMHFYISVGTVDQMRGWKGPVNMPLMRGQGSYQHKQDDTYRFLVIDRFDTDLDKHFQNGKNPLSQNSIGTAAVQILNTLEYIHSKGYTHNDVKAANLLFGLGKDCTNLYLVDFGLCVKYIKSEGHKEYKADPRKAHDGTIEYLSRDAHIGCTSRRSDLEVLCYNLYHWYTGSLPWSKILTNPLKVEAEKKKFMDDVPSNLTSLPKSIQNLFVYVKNLDFQEKPDYQACRDFFKAEMKATGGKFTVAQSAKPKTPKSRKHSLEKPSSGAAKKPAPRGRAKKAAKLVVESDGDESEEVKVDDDDDEEDIFAATPPSKLPRNGTSRRTPMSARKNRTLTVKPVAKYKEAGCQTSPGFVAAAKTAGKLSTAEDKTPSKRTAAKKLANGDSATKKRTPRSSTGNGEPEKTVNGSRAGAKKAGRSQLSPGTKRKAKTDPDPAPTPAGMANPTPAMLEIMRRKQEIEAEKAARKRKK